MFSRRPKLPMDWDRIEASASGRLVLMGEFFDLDDRHAIAAALDRRLHVTIRPHKEGHLRLNLKNFNHVREWPTTLPIFTMTKLVANYADTLNYSNTIKQTLMPLLNQKYFRTSLNVQHSQNTTATFACQTGAASNMGNANNSSGEDIKTFSQAGTTLQTMTDEEGNEEEAARPMLLPNNENDDNNKPTIDSDVTNNSEQGGRPLFHEVRNSNQRVLDPNSQTDSAVIAFFILYMALGDSFAGSLRPSLDVEIESSIPMCRGLGSSTALGVALCGALMKVFRISSEPSVTIEWAHCIDRFFHTRVTTLHSSVVTHGGYIYYQKDRVRSFGAPHPEAPQILLIDSGVRRNPNEVSAIVAKTLKLKIEDINMVLNQLNLSATSLWRFLNDPQFKPETIKQSLLFAQGILSGLGLDHDRIDTIIRLAHRSGHSVKQSQAGESVFMLYDEIDLDSVNEFINDLEEANFKHSTHTICYRGLKVEIFPKSTTPPSTSCL